MSPSSRGPTSAPRRAARPRRQAQAQPAADPGDEPEQPAPALHSLGHSRLYLAHVLFMDWRNLPGRRSGPGAERVWVLGAADREGRHRTRLLVVGPEWRPRCLRHVNMLSQPVVYAGGGRGFLTADLFLWWFRHEFAPAAAALHPGGALLVAEEAENLPSARDCVGAGGRVRLLTVPRGSLRPGIVVRELRARLAARLLLDAAAEARAGADDALEVCVRRFSLKEAFAELHRAWLSVRPESFGRCWLGDEAEAGSGGLVCGAGGVGAEEEEALAQELRRLAVESGLRVDEEELHSWFLDKESEFARCVGKREPATPEEEEEHGRQEERASPAPEAREVVALLSRVLRWMEGESLDPGFLLAARAMRATATFMASKMGLTGAHPSGLPFFCPNGDHLSQPPPAHMGIPPYGALDAGKAAAAAGEYWPSGHHRIDGSPPHPSPTWKQLLSAAATTTGLTRAPMYPFSTGQYPYPMLSPEMTQVAASWHTPSMYPISPASAGFRSPYPTTLPITSSSLPSDLYRFSPTGLMPPHPGLSPHAHALASHALVSSAPKADHSTLDHNHSQRCESKYCKALMAMEPECLEPLNLVIKKHSTDSDSEVFERSPSPVKSAERDRIESKIENNMAILQDAVKYTESGAPVADQKFLTALYMSSLMQISNASTHRNLSPSPYNVQQNFMQLLAMVEARHKMWQQLSWSMPPNFLRNPVGLPQPYFDGSITNLNEQLCNSPNSLLTYPLPSTKQEQTNHDIKQTFLKRSTIEPKNSTSLPTDNTKNTDTGQQNNQDKKKPHIKKPLNAFMLYMKEMRAKVVAECTLKESAAINQILGRRWHALGREEQAKYYELARRERQLHMQLYPDWSSRANTNRTKKRKRKQDTNSDPGGNNMKKCRARFGLDQQSQWCKPCSPVEHGAGMGIHASIIHHGVGSSAGSGGGVGGGVGGAGAGGGQGGSVPGPPGANPASNASSPQQEPTYVNL